MHHYDKEANLEGCTGQADVGDRMSKWAQMRNGSKFDGKCRKCDAPFSVGSKIWFIEGQQGYFDSEDCLKAHAAAQGIALDAHTPAPPATPAPAAVSTPSATQQAFPAVFCDVCGENIARDAFVVERRGEEYRLCRYCYMTRRRAYLLKKHGLWPFVAKGEVIETSPVCPICNEKMKLLNEHNDHFPPSFVCVGKCVDDRQLRKGAQDVKA